MLFLIKKKRKNLGYHFLLIKYVIQTIRYWRQQLGWLSSLVVAKRLEKILEELAQKIDRRMRRTLYKNGLEIFSFFSRTI